MIRRCAGLAGLLLALVAGTAAASTGIVINPQGEPLEGVAVCYRVAGVNELCVSTDADGKWALPKSDIDALRLTLDGYLPKEVVGGDHPDPVMLELAASLLVKLEDRKGRPVPEGEIEVVYSSGKRIGPIPISRAAGTRVHSLEPGPVVIVARSEGYVDGVAGESELRGGEETEATVTLKAAKK